METLRGLKVFRDDPEWLTKMLVMAVLMFIPFAGPIVVTGWTALMLRGLVKGRPTSWQPPLRFDMDYLMKLADPGFKGWLVAAAWTFPIAMLVGGIFFCVYFGVMLAVAGAAAGAERAGAGGIAGFIPCVIPIVWIIFMPILLAAQIPAMCAATRAELTGELKDGFAFKEVMDMTKLVFRDALIGLLIITVVSIPLVLLGELACFVGIFVSMYVIWVVRVHFQAQLYQRYLDKGGAPLPIASDEIVMPPPPGAAPTM